MDSWLLRACATLGIKLVHSRPGKPQGRGKIERFFRSVRDQFLIEITDETAVGIEDLATLNRLLTAWIETVYHPRPHSETGVAPLQRWKQGIADPLPLPTPGQLREAFLWPEFRTVTKTGMVSLHNNRYRVDDMLIGRKVELVFDPFDLGELEVRYRGRSHGKAVAFTLGRHVHPKARPDDTGEQASAGPSGIDYLKLLDDAHTQQLESRINYTALFDDDTDGDDGEPGPFGAEVVTQ